jgi:hypothetical protein
MKRIVATMIAVCALTTASHGQSAARPTSANHVLLQARTISKDVSSLNVQDTGGSFVVLLYGKSFPDNVQPFKPFDNVTVRAWLLRHDGTAQPRENDKPPATFGLGNAGSVTEIMSFGFARSSPRDLAAVVISVNGEMFVRAIK